MKNSLLPLLTLIIGLAAGYYFFSGKAQKTTPSLNTSSTYTSATSISYDEAKLLVDTFGTHWMDDNTDRIGGKGWKTRSVFLPLKELDSLVAALDAERKKDGKTDGMRIYFARYPKFHADGKTPYDHPRLNTIVMVSTKATKILPRGAHDSLTIHLDYFGSPNKKSPMGLFALDPQNRGELCPDNCDGASLLCPNPDDPTCPIP